MRLYRINPRNPLVCLTHVRKSRWNHYRVWKPLGLTTLAALPPPEWEITIFDETLCVPDFASLPRPDLVGVTAFTSQASRAYEVAADFRSREVPAAMGAIHATMRPDEAMARVDCVVTGEAEGVWAQVLSDFRNGALRRVWGNVRHWRRPLIALVANLSYRGNINLGRRLCEAFIASHDFRQEASSVDGSAKASDPGNARIRTLSGKGRDRIDSRCDSSAYVPKAGVQHEAV